MSTDTFEAIEPGWKLAMTSAVELIREYAAMIESGEAEDLNGPQALRKVAAAIERTPLRIDHVGD